jgi:hypothetical protein
MLQVPGKFKAMPWGGVAADFQPSYALEAPGVTRDELVVCFDPRSPTVHWPLALRLSRAHDFASRGKSGCGRRHRAREGSFVAWATHESETSLRPGLQVSGIPGYNQRRTRAAYRSYSAPNFTFRYCSSGRIAPQRSNPAETGTATRAQNDGQSSAIPACSASSPR